MESWVSLGRKEGHTNIQISAEMELPWTLWSESNDLTIASTTPAQFLDTQGRYLRVLDK